jgi:hypothetical protein
MIRKRLRRLDLKRSLIEVAWFESVSGCVDWHCGHSKLPQTSQIVTEFSFGTNKRVSLRRSENKKKTLKAVCKNCLASKHIKESPL